MDKIKLMYAIIKLSVIVAELAGFNIDQTVSMSIDYIYDNIDACYLAIYYIYIQIRCRL